MYVVFFIGMSVGLVCAVFLAMVLLSVFPAAEPMLPFRLYDFLKDIGGPVAAGFGGAITGAVVTYLIQSQVEKSKEKVGDVSGYNKGVAILISKYREVASIKKDAVTPYQNGHLRFLTIPSIPEMPLQTERSTDFLNELMIKSSMGELLSSLMVAEQKYIAVMMSISERNRTFLMFRDEFDAVMSKRKGRQRVGLKELVDIHGYTKLLRLYELSEMVVTSIDDTLSSLDVVLNELQNNLAPRFNHEGLRLLGYLNDGRALELTSAPFYKDTDELAAAMDQAEKPSEG
ncbi:hypothetical protein PPUJ20066_08230 [Pseudomonas putida]|nr:hypothetical protein PPUJ20066_08230 [Pseudomonas putida]